MRTKKFNEPTNSSELWIIDGDSGSGGGDVKSENQMSNDINR